MRYLLSIILLLSFGVVSAQTVGQLRYDTVKVTKANGIGNAELIIKNATRDTLGIATNVGGGLIRYIRAKAVPGGIKIGLDTITVTGTGGGNDSAYVDSEQLNDSTFLLVRDNGIRDTFLFSGEVVSGSNFDTSAIYAALAQKVNISDTAAMLSPYLRGVDTLNLSDRINTKITQNAWIDISATSTITGFTSYDTKYIQYMIVGKVAFVQWNITSASTAGNGSTTTFTLPFNVSSFGGGQWGDYYSRNNNTTQAASVYKVEPGANLMEFAPSANDGAFSSWNTGTTRAIRGFAALSID